MIGSSRAVAFIAAAALVASCRDGCREQGGVAGSDLERTLAAFPGETRIVLSIDTRRMRASPVWQRLSTLAGDDERDRRVLADFTARTGLDPLEHVHRIVAAFPEDARANGSFGIVINGERFDERRLVTYARDQQSLSGGTVSQKDVAGRRLWFGDDGVAGFFEGQGRFVLGGGGWAERMAALASGEVQPPASRFARASHNRELVRLCERASGKAIWAAAIVPEGTRRALRADPRFDVGASIMRLAVGIDLSTRIEATLVAELATDADARALVERVDALVRTARQSPQALVLGLGPYLAGVSAKQEGPNARFDLRLDEAQTSSLLERVTGLVQLARVRRRTDRASAPSAGAARGPSAWGKRVADAGTP